MGINAEDFREHPFLVDYVTCEGGQFVSVKQEMTQQELGRLLCEAPAYLSLLGAQSLGRGHEIDPKPRKEVASLFLTTHAELLKAYKELEERGRERVRRARRTRAAVPETADR